MPTSVHIGGPDGWGQHAYSPVGVFAVQFVKPVLGQPARSHAQNKTPTSHTTSKDEHKQKQTKTHAHRTLTGRLSNAVFAAARLEAERGVAGRGWAGLLGAAMRAIGRGSDAGGNQGSANQREKKRACDGHRNNDELTLFGRGTSARCCKKAQENFEM